MCCISVHSPIEAFTADSKSHQAGREVKPNFLFKTAYRYNYEGAELKRAHQGFDHLVVPFPEKIRSSGLQLVLRTLNVEEDKQCVAKDLHEGR